MNNKEKKEFYELLKMDITEHLEKNDGSIKVRWHAGEGIIIDDINFNYNNNNKEIFFPNNNEHNYTYIGKDKKNIDTSKIKRITFNNCTFLYEPRIIAGEVWYIEFNNCNFENVDDLSNNILADININKKVYFKNCTFNEFRFGGIEHIQNSNIKLSYFKINGGKISKFTVENIQISSKFYINKEPNDYEPLKINKLTINNSIFEENFKMHNCEIDEISIQDSDFKKQFDFYKSTFKSGIKNENDNNTVEINFNGLNITGLSIFDNTVFKEKMVFGYISFENSINFRNATFTNGFDLDRINFWNDSNINFYNLQGLDTTDSINNTSQETYRVIKYHLDSIGNKIDANKYHSLELLKKHDTIWSSNKISPTLLSDGIVSAINYASSYFSTYWILPLIWIFIVGGVTSFNIDEKLTYDSIFKFITIWSNIDSFCDNHIVYMLNKVSLGYLYYQFLTAVRKDTRK